MKARRTGEVLGYAIVAAIWAAAAWVAWWSPRDAAATLFFYLLGHMIWAAFVHPILWRWPIFREDPW